MLSKVYGCSVVGVDGYMIDVEVDVANGLPSFSTVGLPDNAVRESKDRVKAAIKNCGFEFPARRIIVNLSPADLKKEGAGFDLPIALGILAATESFQWVRNRKYCLVGELSLDGAVHGVSGILPLILSAQKAGMHGVIIPADNMAEAAIINDGIDILAVSSLPEVVEFLAGTETGKKVSRLHLSSVINEQKFDVDFSDIKGQEHAKRALEIAASGSHNVLLSGPPGSGKTMLARRLPTILPQMQMEEIIDTTKVYSISGTFSHKGGICSIRPFRSPHHTISDAGLIGGSSPPKPGEVSLAHNGVLFLDEMPEFKKHVLEALRQPMEDGEVTISRANIASTFPARFLLIGAMNPCPCGYLGDVRNNCICTEAQVRKYVSKLSGPLLDRIDMHIEVPALNFSELTDIPTGESSLQIKKRVDRTRAVQEKRFREIPNIYCNSQMSAKMLERFCSLGDNSKRVLEKSITRLKMSARAYHRILKLARTIADMEEQDLILPSHIAEAVQYSRFSH